MAIQPLPIKNGNAWEPGPQTDEELTELRTLLIECVADRKERERVVRLMEDDLKAARYRMERATVETNNVRTYLDKAMYATIEAQADQL